MLALNLLVSAVIMYLVMFRMIDGLSHFYNNANTFYMALMMVAPMGVLMLVTMRSMYAHKRLNIALYALFTAVFVAAFKFTREQTFVGDVQFLRSMIPHHSGAVLMCAETAAADAEIVALCGEITRSQREEIAQMQDILARLRP